MLGLEPPSLDPFPAYRHLRDTDPVSRPAGGGPWNVYRFDDVKRVLSDHEHFSSRLHDGGGPLGASIVATDPPRHRQLRSLVTLAFTPRAVAALAPRITALAHELLDQVARSGRMDLVDDFAGPLPVIVIAELLGIPPDERATFRRWSDAIVTGQAQSGDGGAAMAEMIAFFGRLIDERRREPRADLISALLAAEIDGRRLDQSELLGFCVLLLVAGNETTTNLLSNSILCFDEHPGTLERLRARSDLLPGAIEEVLRYLSPVQSMFRTVARGTTLRDQELRPGDVVLAWIGSANRDPDVFADPDQFDIARSPNQHLAFGHGIHFCLGAPLARLEAQLALTVLLERLPRLRRDRDVTLERLPSVIVYGLKHLPVAFD